MAKCPLEDYTLPLEASTDTTGFCLWIILAPVGMPLSIYTFWACALLEVDKCALQKRRTGMHADSFMALSKTESAWLMVSLLTMPAGRCLCICTLTSICICEFVCVFAQRDYQRFLFFTSVLFSDLFSKDFWCIPKSWVNPQMYRGNKLGCGNFIMRWNNVNVHWIVWVVNQV